MIQSADVALQKSQVLAQNKRFSGRSGLDRQNPFAPREFQGVATICNLP
jgi:hypothetical protein